MIEGEQKPDTNLFTHHDDYINLSEVVRDYPYINEITLNSKEEYQKYLKEINFETHAIPVFVKDNKGVIHIISSLLNDDAIQKGNKLMYVGKKVA